jgi:hypothetical protein
LVNRGALAEIWISIPDGRATKRIDEVGALPGKRPNIADHAQGILSACC